MYIPATIRLSPDCALAPVRPMIRISVTAHELHALARAISRDADTARMDGRHEAADQLDWRVAALREAAR